MTGRCGRHMADCPDPVCPTHGDSRILYVYGTLRPGGNDIELACGSLYDLGWFPSIKPGDRWCISLCRDHHAEQHQVGERSLEQRHGINLRRLAEAFFARSPHRAKLDNRDG